MGIVLNDRGRGALDQIPDGRLWIMLPQRRDGGGGEHDVADEAKPNQQDLQGSTVASSISITGMSSLIGYTR